MRAGVTPKRATKSVLGVTLAVPASPIRACPVCDSDRGKAVRAEVFGADFGLHLLGIALPFAVVAALSVASYYDWARLAIGRKK